MRGFFFIRKKAFVTKTYKSICLQPSRKLPTRYHNLCEMQKEKKRSSTMHDALFQERTSGVLPSFFHEAQSGMNHLEIDPTVLQVEPIVSCQVEWALARCPCQRNVVTVSFIISTNRRSVNSLPSTAEDTITTHLLPSTWT